MESSKRYQGGHQKRSRTTSEVNSEYSDVLESDESDTHEYPPKSVGRQDSRKESRGASSVRSSSQPRSRVGAISSDYQRK